MTKMKDVENFVRFLIESTNIYTTDKDGYVVDHNDNTIVTKVDGVAKPLMVIQEVIKDNNAVVINPLNENLREDKGTRWLYAALATGFSNKLISVVHHMELIRTNEEDNASSAVTKEFSKFISKMTNKTYNEFQKITTKKMEFANVVYKRKQRKAHFRCLLFETSDFPILKGVTKFLNTLYHHILGATNEGMLTDKYTYKSMSVKFPKLESVLNVYLMLYSQINDKFGILSSDLEIDMTEFAFHMNNLDDYHEKTKWFTGTPVGKSEVTVAEKVTPLSSPHNVQGGIPLNPGISDPNNISLQPINTVPGGIPLAASSVVNLQTASGIPTPMELAHKQMNVFHAYQNGGGPGIPL